MARVANAIGLVATAILIVNFIMSTPVPKAHTVRECEPIGNAVTEYEYEQIGDWIVRK
jgi:hypothetical protein